MEKTLGFLSPIIIFIILFVLNVSLPGRWVKGYITRADSYEKMRYRLNGILVFHSAGNSSFHKNQPL